jgi:hypothetical protein
MNGIGRWGLWEVISHKGLIKLSLQNRPQGAILPHPPVKETERRLPPSNQDLGHYQTPICQHLNLNLGFLSLQSLEINVCCLCYFVVVFSTVVWTQGLHLEPFHQPFFVLNIFEIGSGKLSSQGWPWTAILLISASRVARITGPWHPAVYVSLYSSLNRQAQDSVVK